MKQITFMPTVSALLAVLLLALSRVALASDVCGAFTSGIQTHDGANGDILLQDGAQILGGGTVLSTTLIDDRANNLSCGSADCSASGSPFYALTFSYPSGVNYGGSSVSGNFTYTTTSTHYKTINIGSGGVTFQGDGLSRYIESFSVASGTITFAPGDYYFGGTLNIEDNVTINLTGTGAVRIFSDQSVNIKPLANLANISDPSRFFVWATNGINIEAGAQAKGFYYASTSRAELGSGATLLGGMAGASQAIINTNAVINYSSAASLSIADGCGSPQAPVLLAEWRFDEEEQWTGVTDEVGDASGNNHHGTAVATFAEWATQNPAVGTSEGTCSYAVFEQGVSNEIAIPDPGVDSIFDMADADSYSITAWVYLSESPATVKQIIMRKNDNYVLQVNNAAQLQFLWDQTDGTQTVTGTTALSLNTWHHIAVVNTPSGRSLYLNGVEDATDARVISGVEQDNSSIFIGSGTSSIMNHTWAGGIDELRIYSGALSASEIAGIQAETRSCSAATQPTPPPAELVAHWTFDEGAFNGEAGEVLDISGNNYHATAVDNNGFPFGLYDSPAIVGSEGTCGYATFNQTGHLALDDPGVDSDFDFEGAYSFASWVRQSERPRDGARESIFQKLGSYTVEIISSGNIIWYWLTASGDWLSLVSTVSLSLDTWHHIALTRDLQGNHFIYIDGVMVADLENAEPQVPSGGPIKIGERPNPANDLFNGDLDELQLYSGTLSVSQVADLMAQTRTCRLFTGISRSLDSR